MQGKSQSAPAVLYEEKKKEIEEFRLKAVALQLENDKKVEEWMLEDEFLFRIIKVSEDHESALLHLQNMANACHTVPMPPAESIMVELKSGTWAPGGYTKEGSPILIVHAHKHHPSKTTFGQLVHAMMQLCGTLINNATCLDPRVTFVVNCKKVGFSQISMELDRKVLSFILAAEFCKHIAKIYLVDGGYTINAAITMFKPFLWASLMELIEKTTWSEITNLLPEGALESNISAVELVKTSSNFIKKL